MRDTISLWAANMPSAAICFIIGHETYRNIEGDQSDELLYSVFIWTCVQKWIYEL